MDFLTLAKKRFSVRAYDNNRKVEKAKLLQILEAGRIAPTGCNAQPQRILVIESYEGFKKLEKAYPNTYGATLAFIVCADHNITWKRKYDGKDIADIDTSIVTTHMMLAATELGLGSVWLCAFNPAAIRSEFNLADHVEPVNILLVGYAACEPQSPDRHKDLRYTLEETVRYESF